MTLNISDVSVLNGPSVQNNPRQFYIRVEGENQHVILGYLPIVLIFIMFMAHAFGVNGVIHVITGEVSFMVRKFCYRILKV